ncbi:MAG: NAD(P)/FAD-dependent oxidoreductase [Luteibacter sp.]
MRASIPSIGIVGAGPGGLTLARILHTHGIAATVYERDAHPMERPQGGTLDLHADGGQLALARAGLTEAFRSIARYEDQGTRLMDRHATLLFEQADPAGGDRPEVDRTALRAVLLDALPSDVLRWDHRLSEIVRCAGECWELRFAGGQSAKHDLVVGADGTWSRVRPLLSRYVPEYTGLSFVEFGIDDIDERHPGLASLIGSGKLDVIGDGKSIIVQRNAHSHVRGYAIFRVPIDWATKRFDPFTPIRARNALVDAFADWDEAIIALFRASTDRFACRPIHALPVGHHWAHRRGVTLLGDAAHVMSPFGGEGVNAAMRDAAELAEALLTATHWDAGVSAYEGEMFDRVVDAARRSAEGAAMQGSHDALALTLDHFRELLA